MKNKYPKDISLQELSKSLKSIFDEVTENKSQYIIENEDGKRAIMLDFDDFSEFMFAVEDIFEDVYDMQAPYNHQYDISPLIERISQLEDNDQLLHLVIHNYVDEELAKMFMQNQIDEEEFIEAIIENPMFDQESIEDEFDPFLADFLDNLDDDLFELIIDKDPSPDLLYKLAHGLITPKELMSFLSDDSKKH